MIKKFDMKVMEMAKRVRIWNEAKYHKYLAEGRGQGELAEYKPWIQIHDFPSKGIVSRVKGCTTGRIHHLMSNLELWYFYLLDWSEKTTDIREQFPLCEISDAIEIADSCGIRYPYDRVSGFPYVLTTDFLITTNDGYVARAIKPKAELQKPRVKEKLEVERRYWLKRDIDWRIITENEIPHTKIRNIEWLCSGNDFNALVSNKDLAQRYEELFMEMYCYGGYPIVTIIRRLEESCGLGEGTGMALFKHLVRSKSIELDLDKQINLTESRHGMYNETEYFYK